MTHSNRWFRPWARAASLMLWYVDSGTSSTPPASPRPHSRPLLPFISVSPSHHRNLSPLRMSDGDHYLQSFFFNWFHNSLHLPVTVSCPCRHDYHAHYLHQSYTRRPPSHPTYPSIHPSPQALPHFTCRLSTRLRSPSDMMSGHYRLSSHRCRPSIGSRSLFSTPPCLSQSPPNREAHHQQNHCTHSVSLSFSPTQTLQLNCSRQLFTQSTCRLVLV